MIFLIIFSITSLCAYENDSAVQRDESWRKSVTTDIIQQYQAPNDVINFIRQNNVTYDPEVRAAMELSKMFLKHDISRIIGHMRLKKLFNKETCTVFGVPEKYIVPFIDSHGILNFDKSYVISMIVHGDFVRHWDKNEAEKLVYFAAETGVVDFYYTNIKRDTNGKNWLIDTQLEKSGLDRRYRAAEQLLLNIDWKVYQYHLEPHTIEYLKSVMRNTTQ